MKRGCPEARDIERISVFFLGYFNTPPSVKSAAGYFFDYFF